MKIKEIEGSPQEILEYQKQQISSDKVYPFVTRQPEKRMPFKFKDEIHWSSTKQQWIRLSNMDSIYMINVLRKMLRENQPKDLLENNEFKALVVNLGYRIEEEK